MKQKVRIGSLGELIKKYRQSIEFEELAIRTRKDYESNFAYLETFWDVSLKDFTRLYIIQIRDKAYKKSGRSRANYVLAVFSMLFNWAINRALMEDNSAQGIKKIKRPKDMPDANRPWSDDERFAVLEAAPWKLKVAIALCMYTGLREGDALRLKKNQFDGSIIRILTQKAGKVVVWVAPAALRKILNDAPAHNAITLAASTKGQPWTEGGFRAEWRKLRIKLENSGKIEIGLTIHGLRHTMGKTLKELGYENKEIALALGHTEAMAKHYTKEADLINLSTEMTAAFDSAEKEKCQTF